MIIEILENYNTEEEKVEMQELKAKREELAAQLDEFNERTQIEPSATISEERLKLNEEYTNCGEQLEYLQFVAAERYGEACKGDLEKIYKDAQKILDAVEKQDFFDYIKKHEAYASKSIKRIEETLAEVKNLQDFDEKTRRNLEKNLNGQLNVIKAGTKRNYYNCCNFLKKVVSDCYTVAFTLCAATAGIHFASLAHKNKFAVEPQDYYLIKPDLDKCTNMLNSIVEVKAAEFYKPPKRSADFGEIEVSKIDNLQFYKYPTSQTTFYLLDMLRNLDDLDRLAFNIETSSKGKTVAELKKGKDNATLAIANDNGNIYLQVNKLELAQKNMKPLHQLFVFLMIKINEQCIFNGEMRNYMLGFDLQDLVDCGLYESKQSARNNVLVAFDILQVLQLKSKIYIKENLEMATNENNKFRVLFASADISNNRCILHLNEEMNWQVIAQYFSMLPKYYFCLKTNAQVLLEYIFFRARLNVKPKYFVEETITNEAGEEETIKKLVFNINFRRVQEKLKLPNENDKDGKANPARVKKRLLAAIDEIKENEEAEETSDLLLIANYEEGNLAKFLDEGYLTIEIKGKYLEYFTEIKKKKAAAIKDTQDKAAKANAKRQEQFIDADAVIIDTVEPEEPEE